MAVNFDNFGFFDYVEGELDDRYEYNSDEYSEIMDSILGTGIIQGKGDNLACEAGAGAAIVNTGVVVVDGRIGILHESKSVLIDSVESGYSRIDRIVARKDLANRIVCLDAIKGTPTTGTPAAPELTRTTSIYEASLCRVLVSGSGIIVTDERGDAALCGYIPQYNNLMGKSMYDTNNDGAVDVADDAEKLGGKAAVLYALAADVLKNSGAQILDGSLDASGSIIAPNFRIDIADGSMWFTGGSRLFRIHYDGGNNLYFHVYNANGTSVVATPLYISAAGEVVAPTINAAGALKSQGTYNRTTTAAANTHISDSASGHHFYRSTSSQRWKTNINAADLEEIRKVLLKILVVNFTSLCECDDPDKVHTGFIAEQLAEIDRRMATYGTDDDGNEQVEGFDSNELISRTVAGWQIHEMEINGIKAKAAKFDALSALLVSKGILTQEEIDGLGDKA